MTKLVIALPLIILACGISNPAERGVAQSSPGSQGTNLSSQSRTLGGAGPPTEVKRCLEDPAVKDKARILSNYEPFYLTGDFDGDGLPDSAVAIKGSITRRNGVVICTGKDRVFILGADNPRKPPFSDMPNDNFVAPQWKVYTKEVAATVQTIDKEPPTQVASPKGDSIAMIWEDGICLIYWDGNRYRWGCGQ
jgi:hypothetical protein